MQSRHLTHLIIGSLCMCFAGAIAAQEVSGTPSTASKADVAFVKHAARDGADDVAMGKLALGKSSNDAVKKLAQRLVEDHATSNEALSTLARGKKISLPTPAENSSTADVFKNNTGDKFDKAWTDAVVKDHQKSVAMFTAEKRQAQDADVRNFADKSLPMLNQHLEMAQAAQHGLTLSGARDGAMGAHKPVGENAFNRVSTPATAASAQQAKTAPAPAASMGIH